MKLRHLFEVGLVLLFVVMASAAMLSLIGPQIGNVFSQMGNGLGGAGGCCPAPYYTEPLPNSVGGQALPNGEQVPAMFFEDYGVNPFIDAEDDALSTFAVDVDTGSYTVVRNYLNEGLLPPDEAIRVEEFINYFDQEYAPPETGAFAIHLEGAPAPYGESDRYTLARVGIQGYEVPAAERPDVLLIFVVDVSGSMDMENRLGLVRESLTMLVEQLRPADRIGIVIYGSQASILLRPTEVADGRAINRLQPSGNTNAEEGLMLAYELAAQYAQPGQITRLILCSDGVANVGQTSAAAILQHATEGTSLSTFGFGMGNYNDVLMEQLADQGDGSYAYIDGYAEAERVFVRDLTGTLLTIAREAKIQVEFNPAVVERYRLLGYENRDVADDDFRNDQVDGGEVGAGHSVTALYEIKFREEAVPAGVAMTVRIRYADPDTGAVTESVATIGREQFQEQFEAASPRFQLSAVVAEFAEILRQSYWARNNSLATLVEDVNRVAAYWPDDDVVQEFKMLVAVAAGLEQ